MSKIKQVFGNKRIVGLAGEMSTGKTNNLVALIVDLKKEKKDVKVYSYGMPDKVQEYLNKLNVKEISSLKQMVYKKDCLLVIDQFERLNLNNKRYREELNKFVNFVYHNNVWVILCSPDIREFNSIIGSVIERWVLKDVHRDNCINGSQLKNAVEEYKGRYKLLDSIVVPKNKLLVINDEEDIIIELDYIKEVDT